MATDTNGVQFRQVALCCRGHTRPVVDVHYSKTKREDKFFFITASKDRQAMLYQGDTGDWIGTFEGHKGAVWGACLNSNATQAATGAADFTAKLWNAVTGDEIATFRHKHIVKAVDFSQDNSHLITGCNDKVIRLFNLGSLDSEPQLFQEHKEAIKCATWAGDQNYFVSAEEIAQIKLWDVRTGSVVKTIDLPGPVFSVELSCDRSLLTVAHKNGISFLDATSMDIVKSHNSANQVFSASIHPQKSCFVAGGAEDTSGKGEGFKVYKFAFEDGQELESYKGHFGPVHCVRYNPDGEVYCSASEDGTVRLWQHTVGKTYGLWKNPQEDPSAATQ